MNVQLSLPDQTADPAWMTAHPDRYAEKVSFRRASPLSGSIAWGGVRGEGVVEKAVKRKPTEMHFGRWTAVVERFTICVRPCGP